VQMQETIVDAGKHWGTGKPAVGYMVYTTEDKITLDLTSDRTNYTVRWINPRGEFVGKQTKISGGKPVILEKPISDDAIVWLSTR